MIDLGKSIQRMKIYPTNNINDYNRNDAHNTWQLLYTSHIFMIRSHCLVCIKSIEGKNYVPIRQDVIISKPIHKR